jgi:hypothetical protein
MRRSGILVLAFAAMWLGCAATNSTSIGAALPAREGAWQESSFKVDRTDYAREWLGNYEGFVEGEFLRVDKSGFNRRFRLQIRYDERTADGRETIRVEGWSELGQFNFRAEVGNADRVVGTVEMDSRPSFPFKSIPLGHRRKFNYDLDLFGQQITGHVNMAVSETDIGPFHPYGEWTFEARRVAPAQQMGS